MKKYLFLLLLLFSVKGFSQGTTITPFDTSGWSPPAGYSPNYGLYYYTLLSNPGGRINLNTQKTDSLLNALVVFTDTKQLLIKNDTLVISDTASGFHSFTSTDSVDSVAISGFDSTDVVVLTPIEAGYNVNDILFLDPHNGYFKVWRNSSGTSGLKYNYVWIKRY